MEPRFACGIASIAPSMPPKMKMLPRRTNAGDGAAASGRGGEGSRSHWRVAGEKQYASARYGARLKGRPCASLATSIPPKRKTASSVAARIGIMREGPGQTGSDCQDCFARGGERFIAQNVRRRSEERRVGKEC